MQHEGVPAWSGRLSVMVGFGTYFNFYQFLLAVEFRLYFLQFCAPPMHHDCTSGILNDFGAGVSTWHLKRMRILLACPLCDEDDGYSLRLLVESSKRASAPTLRSSNSQAVWLTS